MKFFAAVLLMIVFGCNASTENGNAVSRQQELTPDSAFFYPANSLLKLASEEVITQPYYIYAITIDGGKRDSVQLTNDQFSALAHKFTDFNIDSVPAKRYYRAASFSDATLHSLTLSYTSIHPAYPVKSMEILMDENGDKVHRIFINRSFQNSDSAVIEKLGWNFEQNNFYINRILSFSDGSEKTIQKKVFWQ